MSRLLLLDANHLMHRAYWAIQRNLSTSGGEQINAVFGVASMLLTMLRVEHPDCIVACFDEGKQTFRHKEHEEYKAGRPDTPDDFYSQIPRVHQCMEAFGIPILSDAEYEADDLIGTLAFRADAQGFDVLIVTGDHDLFQIATDRIRIAIPHKGYSAPEYLDAAGVGRALGVSPAQVPDYKGLTGDSSDNLSGVLGIGPKTAAKLLSAYGTLEGVYEHLDAIAPGVRAKLEKDRESAFFSRKMARIVTDVSITCVLQDICARKAASASLDTFFSDLDFHTLRRRFRQFLTEDAFAAKYFSSTGEAALPPEEDLQRSSAEAPMTAEQLPLLD